MSERFWTGPAGTADPNAEMCDHYGGPLDDEAETDDALQMICGACVESERAETFAARQGAIRAAHNQQVWERAQIADAAVRLAA